MCEEGMIMPWFVYQWKVPNYYIHIYIFVYVHIYIYMYQQTLVCTYTQTCLKRLCIYLSIYQYSAVTEMPLQIHNLTLNNVFILCVSLKKR